MCIYNIAIIKPLREILYFFTGVNDKRRISRRGNSCVTLSMPGTHDEAIPLVSLSPPK